MEKITLCGDNCLECPRYLAKTEDELAAAAELWYRVGWRNRVVSTDEIACSGCSSHKKCTYEVVECTRDKGVEKCDQCGEFPCGKIQNMLKRSEQYRNRCKEVCTDEEFDRLQKAFFCKEINLRK